MIIDGKKLADETLYLLGQEIKEKQLKLKLVAILVSLNPGLKKFVELKKKAAEKIGIDFELRQFPENISNDELMTEVEKVSNLENVSGVLVELPLPDGLDRQKILNKIPEKKDVDVLSEKSENNFFKGNFEILPPAVEAVKIILEKYKINSKNKKVAVFGQGVLVGKPISYWFSKIGSKVFAIDEFTKNPKKYSLMADILVSGVGKPDLIDGDMIKEGVIIFDFGYENKEGKMVGDVDFDSVSKKAKFITPVPGGMGPLVVVSVLKNLITLSGK